MCPAAVLRIAMKRRIALGENDVIVPRAEKNHTVCGRGLHERQTQNFSIEFLARIEVADSNAKMNDTSGLDHAALSGVVSAQFGRRARIY
jgi:hypothetical protein